MRKPKKRQLEFDFMKDLQKERKRKYMEVLKTTGLMFGAYFGLIGAGLLADYISKHSEVVDSIRNYLGF